MKNIDLKPKYDEMHAQGPSAWTNTGWNERLMILQMMDSWEGLNVLEIGCGEGDLAAMMAIAGARAVLASDYSYEAIEKARRKYVRVNLAYIDLSYTKIDYKADVLVMQGVLEHLDDPWKELEWMLDNLLKEKGTLITTSPAFLNCRGYIWMYLALAWNAPVSKTDLHFLHPWEFEEFAIQHGLNLDIDWTDYQWGYGKEMISDYTQRFPKIFKDHKMTYSELGHKKFLNWASLVEPYIKSRVDRNLNIPNGATVGYKFWR